MATYNGSIGFNVYNLYKLHTAQCSTKYNTPSIPHVNTKSQHVPFANNELIYIPNKKTTNTIKLKSIVGIEVTYNNFFNIYSENTKYLRQASLNYSLHQRTLSTECYVYFKTILQQAISRHSLTKAIKIDKKYVYPWDVITQNDVEKIIENAKHHSFISPWFKIHQNAPIVNKSNIQKELPVLIPQFVYNPILLEKHIFTNRVDKGVTELRPKLEHEPELEPKPAVIDKSIINDIRTSNNTVTGSGKGDTSTPPETIQYGIDYTWLGHATGIVSVDGLKVLIDPVFKEDLFSFKGITRSIINWFNENIIGGLNKRIIKPPCEVSKLPGDIHAVFVSHNHPDHIMEEDVRILCKLEKFKNLIWYIPEGLSPFLLNEGCNINKINEMSWGDERWISCWLESNNKYKCKDGLWQSKNGKYNILKYKIIFAPSLHWSGRNRNYDDLNQSLWGSLILKGPKHKFYFSGDTAYLKPEFDEFKKIGRLHGPFHLAAISIGSYEPNDKLKYLHVHPWEAIKIWRDVKAEIAIGIHWGTFLTNEDLLQPRDE
uniref:Metallo-beta-lactamase domain-containing protein n=1 Tax=Piliocolobus tephrosceles TaxID=591936 RepID=A0A8C9LMR7_9PRIM